MKYILCLALLLFVASNLQAQNRYEYKVDLTNVVDDRLFVELKTPKITTSETVFYLPKIIPGTYAIADYGRFVTEVKAFDKKGKELPVEKLDTNSWKISDAQKLAKVTYWVDDIIDAKVSGPSVYPMAATNIEAGKNVVLNTSGFFGYFENQTNVPVALEVVRDKSFYGSTGLIPTEVNVPATKLKKEIQEPENKRIDRFSVENYDRLIDSPIMYAQPDTAIIRVANTDVLIGVYSPNHKINAKEIASTVKEILMAQNQFLGGKLPVEKYAFLFYFTEQPILSYGALEHWYSSFYYMPETTIDKMRTQLRDFAAHEFFHIVTPLNIHSKEIHSFGFNDPEMSKHLWLYEGVTEYFAGSVQVKYGIISRDEYLEVLHKKMRTASFFRDDISFTDLSKFTLDKYGDQYGNVYQKGALIGMCLDIKLRSWSKGNYGLQDLLADLAKRFGKNQPFDDESLFDEIGKLTAPEIKDFLEKYVNSQNPLPYKDIFSLVGVNYVESVDKTQFSLGYGNGALGLGEWEGEKKLAVVNIRGLNEQGRALGVKQGDVILQINGKDLPALGPDLQPFLAGELAALKEGQNLSYTVGRKRDDGSIERVVLTAPVQKISVSDKHVVSFDPNATPEQLALREAWLTDRH